MPRPRAKRNVAPDSFSARLQELFDTVHPPDRGPWSVAEVAEKIQASPYPVSESYLWQMLRGTKDNPTLKSLESIAAVFEVPVSYFFTGPETKNQSSPADDLADENFPDENLPSLADRLRRLFQLRPGPDGNELTVEQVCNAVAKQGVTLLTESLEAMLAGESIDPTVGQLRAIAKVFGIKADYFLGDESTIVEIDAKLGVLAAMKNSDFYNVAVRASRLTPHDYKILAAMVDAAGERSSPTTPSAEARTQTD